MKIYSIKDRVAEKFLPPDLSKNDGVAVRKFTLFIKETNQQMKGLDLTNDFSLYCLGDWDEDEGIVKKYPAPIEITGFNHVTGKFNDLTEVK
jgi:hypothetical protein